MKDFEYIIHPGGNVSIVRPHGRTIATFPSLALAQAFIIEKLQQEVRLQKQWNRSLLRHLGEAQARQ